MKRAGPGRDNRRAAVFVRGALLCAIPTIAFAGGCATHRAERIAGGASSPPSDTGLLTDDERAAQVASFDFIWTTIRDRHWDPTLGGVDWDAARTELRPQVAAATTVSEAREVLKTLIGRVRQSHLNIIPAAVYADLGQPDGARRGDGSAGIQVTMIDGQALVRTVEPLSAAAAVGVAPGWIVTRIAGEPVAPLLARIGQTYAGSPLCGARRVGAVQSRLEGRVGECVRVEFLDGADRVQVRALVLRTPPGNRAGAGHLPPQYVRLEQRTLPGGIAYVSLNYFLDPERVVPALTAAVAGAARGPGLVLDLRGNPGGIAALGAGLAGYFVRAAQQALGTMKLRDAAVRLTINPREPAYDGPLGILIDGTTASTAEFVAAGLQDLGRARVFGARSAGAALPSLIERLPNGDGFQFPIAQYETAGGAALEGVGVAPDVEVELTRAALLAGDDPVLDAAVAWIRAGVTGATDAAPPTSADRTGRRATVPLEESTCPD